MNTNKTEDIASLKEKYKKAMDDNGIKCGMPGYLWIGDDGKCYMWGETTPLINRVINFFEIFGRRRTWGPICLDDFNGYGDR